MPEWWTTADTIEWVFVAAVFIVVACVLAVMDR